MMHYKQWPYRDNLTTGISGNLIFSKFNNITTHACNYAYATKKCKYLEVLIIIVVNKKLKNFHINLMVNVQ